MNLSGIFPAVFVIAALVWALGLAFLVRRFFVLYSLRRHAEALTEGTFPDEANALDVFGQSSEIARIAGRFIRSFQRADTNRVLSFFDVDRQAGPLTQNL